MEKEVWKDIDGFEGFYQVSSFGRVKSKQRTIIRKDGKPLNLNERILKPGTARGYLVVALHDGSNRKDISVHRLVASAFVPNPNCKNQVNHKDEDKTNNHYLNLEWVTQRENINYGTGNTRKSKALQKRTTVIDPDGCRHLFSSRREAARFAGFKSDIGYRLKNGSFTTRDGFTFVSEVN